MIRQWLHRLTDPLRDRLARQIALRTAVVFLVLYLYSVGNIVIAPGVDLAFGRTIPSALIVADWSAKIWKPIAPFVWEPILALYPIRSVAVFIAVPNLLLALFLGILVALNMSIAIARARILAAGKTRGGFLSSFLASIPALLTGFTCCVQTIVLALGSLAAVFTATAVTIAPYFLPFAALALLGNLFCGLRQFSCALPTASDQKRPIHLIQKRNKEKET